MPGGYPMSRPSTKSEAADPAAELRAVMEHALVGVCVLDGRDLRARWCNPAFRRFVAAPFRGYDLSGVHAREFVPRYVEHGYEQVFRLVATSGRPFVNPEAEHADPGGGTTYWRWSVLALPSGQGGAGADTSPPALMIQAVDVTDQVTSRRYASAAAAAEARIAARANARAEAAAQAESAARAEAATWQQEVLRVEAILDSADEGLVVSDTAGNVLHMNAAARRIHGYGPDDQPVRRHDDFADTFELRDAATGGVLAPDEWPLARALRGETFSGYELLVRRLDVDHDVVAEYSGATVLPHGGRDAVVIVGVRDVTARRHAQAELERARREAESASRAKDEFLAVLSHELRTPLTPVLTAAQAMEQDPEVPESLRATAGMIRRNVELEARLIDDLLDLTRISRGKLRLDFARTDLQEQVKNVVEILEHDARAKGVELVVVLAARRHHVRADPARLQQVAWNLLKNAIKFTPEHGRVTVATSDAPDGQILLEVIDTGFGIDPEVLPTIFDAFKQGSGEVTRQFGGLGLGLAITHVLVHLHGGTITAESPGPGRGSRFAVHLPTVAEPSRSRSPKRHNHGGSAGAGSGLGHVAGSGLADVVGSGLSDAAIGSSGLANAAATAAANAARRHRRRILLVEDHDDTAHVMSMVLQHQGHTVRRAGTVAAALQAAQAEPFDLLISDIGLPDGSGLDLMRQLRHRLRQPVRGIALSGFGMDDDITRSRDAGFEEHLTKPVSLDVLETTIKRVVES